MTTYHNYLVTSLDLHMVNLEEFKYGGTNLTAFRLLNPEREEVRQVVQGGGGRTRISLVHLKDLGGNSIDSGRFWGWF